MQRTIVIEHEGKKIVSRPFTFEHACMIDDQRYKNGGLATGARNALIRMFEGTTLTEEIIDNDIEFKELRKITSKILDMFLGVDVELKN